MEWALAELTNHQQMLLKARNKIDNLVGTWNQLASRRIRHPRSSIHSSHHQRNSEATPPLPTISRMSVQECTINGYKVPRNSLLFVNVMAIGRDPKYWENPLQFQPERFLKSTIGGSNVDNIDIRGQHYQLPFGTGRRSCSGLSMAMLGMQTALAAMVQCFDWNVVDSNGEVLNGKVVVGITERPVPWAQDLVCVPVLRPGIKFDL